MPHITGCSARIAFHPFRLGASEHGGVGLHPSTGGRADEDFEVRGYIDPWARTPVPRHFIAGTWCSPVVEPGFTFTELVPSWHAHTPGESWIEVAARARTSRGWSPWRVLARWADHDAALHSTSVPAQSAEEALVATDTLVISQGASAWQLRVSLLAPAESDANTGGPVLTYAAAMVSAPETDPTPAPPGAAAGIILDVPALSQRIHAGHYPRWGGGGESWCSPTSVTMVLQYWGAGPEPAALAWVRPDYPDRVVYHAVRHCWDHAYQGAGNWSFNTAYAARFGLHAFVTRLHDLAEAEAFIATGVPLVASMRVDPTRLSGAEYTSKGHLLVVVGFTPEGDVVVNDPAAVDLATLRRAYRREEFDEAWRTGSHRIVYVLHPPAVALPRSPVQNSAEANW
jgi:hypothetical protein